MGVRLTLWAVDPDRLVDVLTAAEVAQAQEDSLLFQRALRRARGSPHGRGRVQLLSDGHRRWWIGSLLESLTRCSPWLLDKIDVAHAEELLLTILAGWDCGTTVRRTSSSKAPSPLSIHPRVDAGLRFAALSATDFSFLRLFLDERLQEPDRRFVRPSGLTRDTPDSDDEWDAWVRCVLREITAPLEISAPLMVSFLG